jgi:methionyl aminopeptidase
MDKGDDSGGRGGGGFGRKVTSTNIRTKKKKTGGGGSADSNFVYAGSLRPHDVSPMRIIDPSTVLSLPDYAIDGVPKKKRDTSGSTSAHSNIELKSTEDIVKMRAAGRVAREVLDIAGRCVKSGVTTSDIDDVVHAACIERKAYPSPLNYRNFPKSCCTSVNEVICHGIPDSRPLVDGDVINIDVTVYLDGYHGDCSEMFVVGGRDALDDNGIGLLQATYDCWVEAMELVRPGTNYNVIGRSIQDRISPLGYTTVREFCGHGIGTVFHASPNIYHYAVNQELEIMEAGQVFTIEPMICEGKSDAYMWKDDWTATTVDGKRSAQFEHTLLVTEDGVEALTGKIETSPIQFWERESKVVRRGAWLGTSVGALARAGVLNGALEEQITES